MFLFWNLAFGDEGHETSGTQVSDEESVSLHDIAVVRAYRNEQKKALWKHEEAVDRREHEQRLALMKTCPNGLGVVFGSSIRADCDATFAAADAIRDGRIVSLDKQGRRLQVNAAPAWAYGGLYGYGFNPGLYQSLAYGGSAGFIDPTAELLRRQLNETGTLRTELDAFVEGLDIHLNYQSGQ